jgi:hypothetical protein
MLSIPWGRSLATTAPPGSVGDECIPPAAQPPGLIPGILATYPGCTPRPRNLVEYRAACNAAEGDHVEEINAVNVMPGATIWHGGHQDGEDWIGGRWVSAIGTLRDASTVEIDFVSDGGGGTRWAAYDTPVYVRRLGSHPMH